MLITVNEQHFRNCESLLFYSQFRYEKHLRNELFECVILKTLQKHFFDEISTVTVDYSTWYLLTLV